MADEVGKVSLGLELDQSSIGKQIGAIAKGMGAQFSLAIKSSMQSVMKGAQASAKSIPAPEIDADKVQAEINQLTALLDNVNAKLDFQRQKLTQLKESYENTFNEARKSKLQQQILNTESAILRLTKQSDSTAAKIWKLEDNLSSAGQAAQKVEQPVEQTEKALKKTNQTLNASGKRFKAAAKGVTRLGSAFTAAGKGAGKMSNQFTQAFSRIAKQVLVFSVLYRAIRGLQSYVGSSLKTNEEYAKSLMQIQMNLKAAFAPIFQAVLPAINALIKAMVTATTYVAAFVSALFGKTYKQSMQAAAGLDKARAAMDKTAKSANKLAGFDELNLLETGGGDDGGFGAALSEYEMPELDIDRIQTQMDALALGIRTTFDRTFRAIQDGWNWTVATFGPGIQKAWSIIQPELGKWKEQFGLMFSDIVSLGEPLKNWWQNDLMPLWEQSIAGVATIYSGLSETVRTVFGDIWDAAFPIIEKFVTDGLPRISEFVTGAQEIFGELFATVKQIFDDIWQDVIDPVMQLISKIVQDALDILFDWWDKWGKKIVDNIRETLNRIKELWDSLWEKLLKPIITKMLDTMKKLWDDHLKDLLKEIGNFIGKLVTAAQDIFNKFIMPIVNWLVKTLGPVVAEVFDGVITIIGGALGAIVDVAKGIIKALGGIVDFIAGVFTGDWKKAWNGIKDFFGGIWDGIVALFKGAINVIIDAMNWLIRQLNKVRIDMPGWVEDLTGWKGFGINIPEIPRLAKGGLVTAPTLAMVGDNPHASVDPEVVAPLSKLQEMLGGSNQEVVEVLYMILAALQDFARRPVILEANGTQLAKVVDDARDDRYRRAGRTLGIV